MRSWFGLVVVLLFAFSSSALARGGPPVPDGCTFARGVTTCVTTSEDYDPGDGFLREDDTFCFADGFEYEVTLGAARVTSARDVVTTEYFGASQVVKSESVDVRVMGYDFIQVFAVARRGPC